MIEGPAGKITELTERSADALPFLMQAIADLRFGQVAVTIHEGRVVQIDVTEKRRFAAK